MVARSFSTRSPSHAVVDLAARVMPFAAAIDGVRAAS
jgi:hypothetical protein